MIWGDEITIKRSAYLDDQYDLIKSSLTTAELALRSAGRVEEKEYRKDIDAALNHIRAALGDIELIPHHTQRFNYNGGRL